MEQDQINETIGRKIRNLRNRHGLTQQELADRTELTKGFISQLERGQVSPSVETLLDLIECLGSTPAEFFKEEKDEPVVYHESEYFEKVDDQGAVTKWLVPPAQKFKMEPILVEIPAGVSLETDKPHAGEEFGYCLEGQLDVLLSDTTYHVKQGECFYYRTTKSHTVSNPGKSPARFLWISTPPQF